MKCYPHMESSALFINILINILTPTHGGRPRVLATVQEWPQIPQCHEVQWTLSNLAKNNPEPSWVVSPIQSIQYWRKRRHGGRLTNLVKEKIITYFFFHLWKRRPKLTWDAVLINDLSVKGLRRNVAMDRMASRDTSRWIRLAHVSMYWAFQNG